MLVTLTRAEATAKGLTEGVPVWLKPVPGASRVKVSGGDRSPGVFAEEAATVRTDEPVVAATH